MTYAEIKSAIQPQLPAAMRRIEASGGPSEGDTQDFTAGDETITFRCVRIRPRDFCSRTFSGAPDFLTFVWRQGDNRIHFGKWHC